MPLTRIRQTAIGNDSITTAKLDDTSGGLTLPGVEYVKVPVGTTAQRPSSPVNGYMRYNTNFERLEQYANGQWQSIDTPPSITSLSYPSPVTAADPAGGETITVAGSNFQSGATVTVGGTSATSVSVVSSTSITFTTPAKTAGDYDVTVTNANGLAATLLNGISYNGLPSFTTAAGNVGSIAEDQAMSTITIVAAEPDGGTLAYSVTSGALPTGVSMSSSGAITGTPNVNVTSNTTYNFTVTATDDENQTNSRAFNLIVVRPVYATPISQSLRFDGTSSYLIRTENTAPTSTTQTTFSSWIKRSELGQEHIWTSYNSNVAGYIYFDTNDKIVVYLDKSSGGSDELNVTTDARFRDLAAWYHVVVKYDVGQASNSNKVKIYVNGVLQSATYSGTGSAVDAHRLLSSGTVNRFGQSFNGSSWFSGYISDLYVIDGQVKEPTDFAAEYNGVWTPIAYSGTYGTNGFHLPFEQETVSGGSSTYFDGSGDRLRFDDASLYDIGSSDDFTIECFFKSADVGADYGNMWGRYETAGPHLAFGYDFRNATRLFYFYTGNGQSVGWDVTQSSITMSSANWHHVVFDRSSGTLRCFLDGERLTSVASYGGQGTVGSISGGNVTSQNSTWNLSNFYIGAYNTTGKHFEGYISNFRMVIGSSVYGSDSNFTVPTSPLTDITNTKLLTCTNSTAGDDVSANDNDAAAVEGNTTTSSISPLGKNFSDDQSGNNNNYGATALDVNDVVSDSPTTNFATFNHNNFPVMTFAEGALKITTTTNSTTVWGTQSIPNTGKWYFEMEATNYTGGGGVWAGLGYDTHLGDNEIDQGGIRLGTYSGGVYINNTQQSGGYANTGNGVDQTADGDVYSFAIDMDNELFYIAKNGTWYNSADPSAGTGGLDISANITAKGTKLYVPALARGGSYNETYTWNFGQDSTFAGNRTATSNADANNVGEFAYTVPTNFLSLCAKNLSEGTISVSTDDRPEDYMTTVLYTGNGTGQSITTSFQPDLVWIKQRNGTNTHQLLDVVRGKIGGAASFARLRTDTSDVQATPGSDSGILSLDSNGFTLGTDGAYNANSSTYAAWSWKAGGAPTATNSAGAGNVPTSGSVLIDGSASTSALAGTLAADKISINSKAGFSIVQYGGNATGGATVAHGLGDTPDIIILKNISSAANWRVYVNGVSLSNTLFLNTTGTQTADADRISAVDSTTFTLSTGNNAVNGSGSNYIAYCWKSVPGYSKMGTFTGQGDKTYVHTGFKPAFLMVKSFNTAAHHWAMYDNKRNTYNVMDKYFYANSNGAESDADRVDFVSNGFVGRANNYDISQSGVGFVYMAFAEDPFKYVEAR